MDDLINSFGTLNIRTVPSSFGTVRIHTVPNDHYCNHINDYNIRRVCEGKILIFNMYKTYDLYFKYGARSSKKVDYFHNYIKIQLQAIFKVENNYSVVLERDIKSRNSKGSKRCDIVVLKNNIPYIVFPVKLTMTNYKQNKNNLWESITGELCHLKWANENLNIVPINILMHKTPQLTNVSGEKRIKKFETVIIQDIKNYEILKEMNIAFDIINYIIDVDHNDNINDTFTKMPSIKGFSHDTKYRTLESILYTLI